MHDFTPLINVPKVLTLAFFLASDSYCARAFVMAVSLAPYLDTIFCNEGSSVLSTLGILI